MIGKSYIRPASTFSRWLASAVVVAALWSARTAPAQVEVQAASNPPNKLNLEPSSPPASTSTDSGVVQAGCASCGSSLFGPLTPGCASCGGGAECVPGQFHTCSCVDSDSALGRLIGGFYQCICCPDPCYEPHYIAAANAGFFLDSTRPVTQTTVRYDAGLNMRDLDRAEYFWPRADGKGKGPALSPSLQYNDLSLIQEIGAGRFSVAIQTMYVSQDPEVGEHHANFGDMNIVTKSLLLDCELLQFAFLFRTYIPTGNFLHGLGTGHVSLEPSLAASVKLATDTYIQAQLAEWIPIGGDSDYEGAILEYKFSLNHVLWRPIPDIQLIGTVEFDGYSFQTGQVTNADTGLPNQAGGTASLYLGAGLRLVMCDKADFGIGALYDVSGPQMPNSLYRLEFRYRF